MRHERGQFKERIQEGRGCQPLDCLSRFFRMGLGERASVWDRPSPFNDSEDVAQSFGATLAQGVANQFRLGGAADAHRLDQGQGGLAFRQVVANRLAAGLGVCDVVDDVVDELVGDAQCVSVLSQWRASGDIGAGRDCTEFGGGAEQYGYGAPPPPASGGGSMPKGGNRRPGSPGDKASLPPAPDDVSSGQDDDIVARQLREAAENETDPELREKLWDEYRDYKRNNR